MPAYPPSVSGSEITKITYAYYCPPHNNASLTQSFQLLPAPMISLTMQTNYASDNSNIVTGYTYTINLNGQVTAYSPYDGDDSKTNLLQKTGYQISRLRRILSVMGGTLHIIDGANNYLLKAKGGTLKSLNFNESPDHWTQTANFTAEIEFNDVEFLNETISYCGQNIPDSGIIHQDSISKTDIVNINKYKIKTFAENLTIELGDDLYSSIRKIDVASNPLTIENSNFVINYNVSANGKHHYIYPDASGAKLLPAWEQAKNFCQYRLTQQIRRLTQDILRVSGNDTCSSSMTVSNFDKKDIGNGIMQTLDGHYKVYNELVDCSISESEGTCDLNYKCIIKRTSNIDFSNRLGQVNTNHKISKTVTKNNDNTNSITIAINGTIEGLVEGALVFSSNPDGTFDIPEILTDTTGPISLIVAGQNLKYKYKYAKEHLDLLLNDNKDDFQDAVKPLLGITFENLGLNGTYQGCESPAEQFPVASVFNLTHNYHDGTISYNLEYNSNKSCGKKLANISINVEKAVPVFATFKIPNVGPGKVGTILQNLGTFTAPKINITIQGRDDINMYCCGTINTENGPLTFNKLCSDIVLPPNFYLPNSALKQYILTNKTKQTNIIDGSYTINLSYMIAK